MRKGKQKALSPDDDLVKVWVVPNHQPHVDGRLQVFFFLISLLKGVTSSKGLQAAK